MSRRGGSRRHGPENVSWGSYEAFKTAKSFSDNMGFEDHLDSRLYQQSPSWILHITSFMKSIRSKGSAGMLKENVRKGIEVNGTIPFPNGFPKLLV